jgi:hypothetical protein
LKLLEQNSKRLELDLKKRSANEAGLLSPEQMNDMEREHVDFMTPDVPHDDHTSANGSGHEFLAAQATPMRNAFLILGKLSGSVASYKNMKGLRLCAVMRDWYKFDLSKGKYTLDTASDSKLRIKACVEFAISMASDSMIATMKANDHMPGSSGYHEQEQAKTVVSHQMRKIVMNVLAAMDDLNKPATGGKAASRGGSSTRHQPFINSIDKRLGQHCLKGKLLDEVNSMLGAETMRQIVVAVTNQPDDSRQDDSDGDDAEE